MASKHIFHKNNVNSTWHSLTILITPKHIPYVRDRTKLMSLLNGGKPRKAQTGWTDIQVSA